MAQLTWITPAGSIGSFLEGTPVNFTFQATPGNMSNTLTYSILNGTLPDPTSTLTTFSLNSSTGVLTGTAAQVESNTIHTFTIRVFEYNVSLELVELADRTFSIEITGTTAPTFLTPSGALYSPYLLDSTWDPFQIIIDNPDPNTTPIISLIGGNLPPGIEINDSGLIQGYASPSVSATPVTYTFTLQVRSESGTAQEQFSIDVQNQEYVSGYTGRAPSLMNTRPPSFNISDSDINKTFYTDTGNLGIYYQNNNFIFKLLGNNFDEGPLSYEKVSGSLPPGLSDNIYYNNNNVEIIIDSSNAGINYVVGNQLRILGSDVGGVDGLNDILLEVTQVGPLGKLQAVSVYNNFIPVTKNVDSNTSYLNIDIQTDAPAVGSGAKCLTINKINASWITGTFSPAALVDSYSFTYRAFNNSNLKYSNSTTFTMIVIEQDLNEPPVDISVNWLSDSNLGTIVNGNTSMLSVEAINPSGLELQYSITSGTLPYDLSLNSSGEIIGKLSFESNSMAEIPYGTTTEYNFTVQAINPTYPEVNSSKQFTLYTYQEFSNDSSSPPVYENIYIKALLSLSDRQILNSLLEDTSIIPNNYIYRINDINFGKSSDIIYQHMYGVPSSLVDSYIAAINKNHYWRNITLGPIKTAIARNSDNQVIYEVVYSEIIDDLTRVDNGQIISISKEILYPFQINGVSEILYPNSLPNMRKQIADSIPSQVTDGVILPAWMTSQQENGSSLGFIPAWVICYTKPYIIVDGQPVSYTQFYNLNLNRNDYLSYAQIVRNNIYEDWNNSLNEINFQLDRLIIDKSLTFDYNPTAETWTTLPGGVVTDDSENQYVYYPQKNILD